ncbi:hypothetical protein MN202_20255 [Rheinheimera muenzenbergensis]|uniref:Uncharacterized protein n=1 Tax=Rheinheimera muenzenbergensis TaxID=1193628 RepID=A0ABU8CC55_9GAMM
MTLKPKKSINFAPSGAGRSKLRRLMKRYELKMKYLPFVVFLYSGITSACVVGPEKVVPTPEIGFEIKVEASDICDDCSAITISAPKSYEGNPYAHALFTVLSNNQVMSKSINYLQKDSESTVFMGIVSQAAGITYEIDLSYGNHRCMSYEFSYTNQ